MTIESVTYISDLDATYPAAGDPPYQGDDHIRNIKTGLVNTFPNFVGAAVTATEAELNILDGLTATAAELNILDGVTATAAELNILDGVTATAAELNILDGVTATAAELNILDGVTATAAELNILDGVTSTTAELNLVDGKTSLATLGTNTFTGNQSIDTIGADSEVVVNSANTFDSAFRMRDQGQTRFVIINETGGNNTLFDKYNTSLSLVSRIDFTDAGNINISSVGTLQYQSSEVVNLAKVQTLTNKTLTSPVINTSVSGTAVLDEDTMVSNSATKLATQQSIKAYVDSQVGGVASVTYETLASNGDVGTSAGQLAIGNHTHTGVYQPYSASNALTSDITYGTLNTNGDVGTSAGQLAIGNHTHTGVYEPANANLAELSDITYERLSTNGDVGTSAGQLAIGNHTHTGVYQAYSTSNALTSDITYETLNTNGDVGTSAGQLAIGNHTHTGVYQAYSASNALTSDITYETLNTNGDVGTSAGQLAIGDHSHAGLSFRGALVYLSSNQSTTSSASNPIDFDTESYDTDSIHSTSLDINRLTVPSGVTKVKLHAQITFAYNATGYRNLQIKKNAAVNYAGSCGASVYTTLNPLYTPVIAASPVLSVIAGDYFEVDAYQNSGGALNILGSASGEYSWFSMEIIE